VVFNRRQVGLVRDFSRGSGHQMEEIKSDGFSSSWLNSAWINFEEKYISYFPVVTCLTFQGAFHPGRSN